MLLLSCYYHVLPLRNLKVFPVFRLFCRDKLSIRYSSHIAKDAHLGGHKNILIFFKSGEKNELLELKKKFSSNENFRALVNLLHFV